MVMNTVVIAGYLSAAGAYFVLALLLVFSWRRERIGGVFIFASTASFLWAAFLAYVAWVGTITASWIFVSEALRYGAWLGFLTLLLGTRDIPEWLKRVSRSVHLPWLALALYSVLAGAGVLNLIHVPYIVVASILGVLLLALCGLILLEQLYRNVGPDRRWALKFLVVALGTIFAYDTFMYSYAALYGHINESMWAARGYIDALVVPLLVVTAARNKQWALPVGVSRGAVFYSSSLLVVTLYILAVLAGGYWVRIYGGNWGTVAEIALGFFAALLLFTLGLSGQARSRFRLFLYKNFFTFRHDYRKEWLRLTAALAAGEGALPLRAIHAVAEMMDCPAGALFLRRDAGRYVAQEVWNMPSAAELSVAVDIPVFDFMNSRQWIYDFSDASPMRDERLTAPAELAALPRAWLMVPLVVGEELIGFLVLAQARARHELNWEDIDLLRTAGRQVASTLALAESARRLAEAQQFEGFNRLTSFMMHDLKNLAAQQALMLKNAERHKTNPAFVEDMLATTASAVQRTNRILQQLRGNSPARAPSRMCLTAAIEKAIAGCSGAEPRPVLGTAIKDVFVRADEEQLTAVLGHLIRNAQEATAKNGLVEVKMFLDGNETSVEVQDTGSGMDEEFIRTRLFKPFYTTKGSKGMGIGAYQAREYVQSLGGKMHVVSAPGRGTTVRLVLPLDRSRDWASEVAV